MLRSPRLAWDASLAFLGKSSTPSLILLAAMTAVFVLGHDDRRHFYRAGHHDWLSSQGLALAANFSPEHGFLKFVRQTLDPEVASGYLHYNRYPPGTTPLIALTIAPFDGLSSRILAARVLMLLFFTAAAGVAWLSLRRLFDGWIALSAVLLSFSSWYALRYNDMIFDEVPSLFGVLLAFHGIVVFVQEGRFRQLLVKSCAALLLGWQVYALLLPFIVFGAAGALRRRRRAASGSAGRVIASLLALARGRHVALGAATLLFGLLVLGFNLANEWRAFDDLPLTKTPTFTSILWRLGIEPWPGAYAEWADRLAWWPYLQQQLASVGGMSLPFLVAGQVDQSSAWLMTVGAGAVAASLIAARRRPALAALAVSGLCWTLPMRHLVAFHDYQSLFYIGIPLVGWSAALSRLLGASSSRRAAAVGVALVVFLGSTSQMRAVGQGPKRAVRQAEIIADFETIRPMTAGRGVLVLARSHNYSNAIALAPHAIDYYLANSRIGYLNDEHLDGGDGRSRADFLLTNRREPGKEDALLTPDARRVFLYDRAVWDGVRRSGQDNLRLED